MNNKQNIARYNSSKEKLKWIAELRGIAALMVFVSHLKILPVSRVILFALGRVGVVCFFLIMGYLAIASRNKRNATQYLVNRAIRIYPIYWILLTIKYLLAFDNYSFKEYVLNLTLFEEFLGLDAMIGESWMLPIQICFFVILALAGSKLLIEINNIEKTKKRGIVLIALCELFAFIVSIVRKLTMLPFPTAIFLLLAVAIIGVYYEFFNRNLKEMLPIILIFETGLIASVVLSYPRRIPAYIIAYNVGMVLFFLYSGKHKTVVLLDGVFIGLGKMGYTFFLGASIPWVLFERIYPYSGRAVDIIIGCCVKLTGTLVIAYFMTRYIERPLLKWEQRIEARLC